MTRNELTHHMIHYNYKILVVVSQLYFYPYIYLY